FFLLAAPFFVDCFLPLAALFAVAFFFPWDAFPATAACAPVRLLVSAVPSTVGSSIRQRMRTFGAERCAPATAGRGAKARSRAFAAPLPSARVQAMTKAEKRILAFMINLLL